MHKIEVIRTRRLISGVFLFLIAVPFTGCAFTLQPQQSTAATPAAAPVQAAWRYIAPDAIDIERLLPAPPDAVHTESRAFEESLTMRLKSLATPAAAQRASKDEGTAVWMFAAVLSTDDSPFTPDRFPRIAALLRQSSLDADRVKNIAKARFARPRPGQIVAGDRAVDPETYSYPSGHAVRAAVHARLLAQIEPDREVELVREAWFYCHSRLVRGAHFPSDVVAGFVLGEAIADAMLRSQTMQDDLRVAREEWASLPVSR